MIASIELRGGYMRSKTLEVKSRKAMTDDRRGLDRAIGRTQGPGTCARLARVF